METNGGDDGDGGTGIHYPDLGLRVVFLLIPWLAHRFGEDFRNGIDSDADQQWRPRSA